MSKEEENIFGLVYEGAITDQVTMCLSSNHKTVENILKRKAFTISMGTANKVVECDYVGVVSGNDEPNSYDPVNHDYLKVSRKVGKAFQDGMRLK